MSDTKPRVLVIGDLIIDEYVYGDSVRLSPEAPVPVVVEKRRLTAQGGAGNVVENLKALGADTKFWYGNKASHKLRIISGHQQVCRLDNDDRSKAPTPADLGDLVRWANAVVISDYSKGVVTDHLLHSVNQFCKTWSVPLLVDPYNGKCYYGNSVTLIKPNRAEAQSIAATDITDAESLASVGKIYKELSAAENLVITLGDYGAALFDKSCTAPYISRSHRPQQVYDVTGAGDTAMAVLAFMWASAPHGHFSKRAAVDWATKAASIVVGKLGTAVVTAEELFGPYVAASTDFSINDHEQVNHCEEPYP